MKRKTKNGVLPFARPSRPPQLRAYFVDLFCGGGGVSEAAKRALGRSPDVAVNHNRGAVAMHEANHPETKHYCEDVHDVDPVKACAGNKCWALWLSPDCTYHSKARGGKPHRDRNRARRRRGLAGVAIKWAKRVRPNVIFLENVEEFQDWGPLGHDGRPDPERRGESFDRWVAELRNLGYVVEWRELRACDYGAPTSRKRLFLVAKCDGTPIVWPEPSHGPTRAKPYRTAAECIDFSRPVPSIFLTRAQARAWGKAHGCPAPRRPLAPATLRRIARGIQKFVLDTPEPFIVNNLTNNVPRPVSQPLATALTGNHKLLVVPTLIQTGYGERKGQAPRSLDLGKPLGTVVGGGSKHGLVLSFLAKHNGGHEATGQALSTPIHSVVTRDQKALVTSHLLKLYGTCRDGSTVSEPLPTVTATGNHLAEVRAFLLKFHGAEKSGHSIKNPIGTVTTRDRFGLVIVTINGEEYYISDIGMRMLIPRELFRAQGFPDDYIIDRGADGRIFTKEQQTQMCGNSVSLDVAEKLISANYQVAV